MDNKTSPFTQIQPRFVFPSAYGGPVGSENPPQIHEMMRKLRIEIGAVEAKKSTDAYGPKFPVRGAKDLAQKLANALNKLNMEAPVVAQEVTLLEADKIPSNQNKSGNPVFRTLAHVKATVRLIAPDTSFIDLVGSGHGGDVDDKSGGKASTYAWKDAILKGLSIPHEDMVDTDDDSSTSDEEPAGGGKARGARKATGASDASAESAGRGNRKAGPSGKASPGVNVESSTQPMAEHLADEPGDSDQKGLAYVLKQIKAANSDNDLEQIRAAVKSGILDLHGADRLSATQAFVARKQELKGASQ